MPRGGIAGYVCNSNLKGKKTKALSCGCCVAINFKEAYNAHLADIEMRNASIEVDDYDDIFSIRFDPTYPDYLDYLLYTDRSAPAIEEWQVINTGKGVALVSSDFTYDAMLTLSGDFATLQERIVYARRIADALNKQMEA